jgi:hypothetical protein
MSYDLALVFGTILAGFSIPSIMSAFSESRTPRLGSLMIVVGGSLFAWAVIRKPGGYTMDEIPDVFVQVMRDLIG